MSHEIIRDKDKIVVKIDGRLDAGTSPALEADLAKELTSTANVTFDLDGLELISSAGLRVLLATYKCVDDEGSMRIVNVGLTVMDVFVMSGFADIFIIE